MKCVFLIPIYNDAVAVQRLLPEIDAELARLGAVAQLCLVDDGSHESPVVEIRDRALAAISDVAVVRLRRNLGHQRAIAIGLCYVDASTSSDFIVVMDGDGEDRPADLPALLKASSDSVQPRIIFAERTRRSEGRLFAVMYFLYKVLHWLLTGVRVRVGNFSVIPRPLLARLVGVSDLWNHYAAAVFKSRLPYATVPTRRGRRYAGESHMNAVALVTHGLSAMAAFGDRIGVRLLVGIMCIAALLIAGVLAGIVLALIGMIQIPSWAPFAIATIVLLLSQAFGIALAFIFVILAGRESSTFLPLRDYSFYILDVQHVDGPVPLRR